MKEFSKLSIEEKAKAYDDAIERANELNYVSDKDSLQRHTVYHIFPELKESDDDKVVIKKGEKLTVWSEEDEEIVKDITEAIDTPYTFDYYNEMVNWLKSLKCRVGCEANCTATKEWSVEDMSKIQRICKYLDEAKKYYADITEVRECMDWLKSLKERVQPQSKQEWSKEDDRMLNVIIADLIGFSHSNTSTLESHFNGCIDWLKSIKDRYI